MKESLFETQPPDTDRCAPPPQLSFSLSLDALKMNLVNGLGGAGGRGLMLSFSESGRTGKRQLDLFLLAYVHSKARALCVAGGLLHLMSEGKISGIQLLGRLTEVPFLNENG